MSWAAITATAAIRVARLTAFGACAPRTGPVRRAGPRARRADRSRARNRDRSPDAARQRQRTRGPPRRAPAVMRARLFPRAAGEGIVAAAPAVAMRDLFRQFWPLARPYRGW